MLTSTISWPELLWVLVSLAGLIFCSKLAIRAVFDLVGLRARRINSIREYAAITTMIAYISWVGTQFLFTVAGLVLLVTPNKYGVSTIAIILFSLVTAGTGLLTWAARTVDVRRAVIAKKLMEIENMNH